MCLCVHDTIAFAVAIDVARQRPGIGSLQLLECPLQQVAAESAEFVGEFLLEIEGGRGRDGPGEKRQNELNEPFDAREGELLNRLSDLRNERG